MSKNKRIRLIIVENIGSIMNMISYSGIRLNREKMRDTYKALEYLSESKRTPIILTSHLDRSGEIALGKYWKKMIPNQLLLVNEKKKRYFYFSKNQASFLLSYHNPISNTEDSF